MSSLIKMLVMVMIFSGRIGRNETNNNNGAARNNNNNNNNGEEDDLMTYLYTLLESLIWWWRGHRVHTLVVASMIAFLFQVGLMSFFYQVLWVDREALLNAYLGRGGDDVGEEGGGDGEQQQRQEQGGGAVEGGGDNINNGVNAGNGGGMAGIIAGANPALAVPQQAAPAIPALIRRVPNNGGFFHDILCLILSFVMSLIPAWKPDEWADPEEEEEQQPQPRQQAVEGAGDNVDDNADWTS